MANARDDKYGTRTLIFRIPAEAGARFDVLHEHLSKAAPITQVRVFLQMLACTEQMTPTDRPKKSRKIS